jgi:hypothetical protein
MRSTIEDCTSYLQGYEYAIHKLIAQGFRKEKITFFLKCSLRELNNYKKDGIYVFYHAPCDTLISESERNMQTNIDEIIKYAFENYETVDKNEIVNNIFSHKTSIRNGMHFDVVIVKVENGKISKYLTLEIADESHRNQSSPDFISKLISDAIKSNGKRSKTFILHCNQYSNYAIIFEKYLKGNGFDFTL